MAYLQSQFASRTFLALALIHSAMALADPQAEAQRALVQRQQQAEEFALRLRQSQQTLNTGGIAQRWRLEMLNLEQRQRQQNLNDQQILQLHSQLHSSEQSAVSAAEARAAQSGYQQQRFEQERQRQMQDFERQYRQFRHEQEVLLE